VRGDLIRVIGNLMKRRGRFDAVLVETTGLADPAPVAQTFFMDEDVRAWAALDAVVTLVDAKHLMLRLKDAPEAEDQIAFADVVLLNKCDLVSVDELTEVEHAIHAINPNAEIHRTERADVDLSIVLDRGAFDLQRILTDDPDFLGNPDHGHHNHECGSDCNHEHHHDHECGPDCDHDHPENAHDTTITSISLRGTLMNPDKFFPWINKITQIDGPDILRLKGIIAFDDDPERYVIQGIHMIVEGDHQLAWRKGETRESRLVFIGRNLDREKLERTFKACHA